MNFSSLRDRSPPVPLAVLWLLVGLYLLTGIVGHDPWKTEDAIHIGIAHAFLQGGDWLFPQIAGEPWPHTPPLYHWVAASLGQLLDGPLEFHDAARLASPLFGLLFLIALAGTAHNLLGDTAGRIAPLLAIGTLGLMIPIHDAQPAIAGIAFAALAWWGGSLILQGKTSGALVLGTGLGLAFLAHGLVGVLMGIAVLPAPIIRRDWVSLFLALGLATLIGASWPLALASQSPDLWSHWWHNELAEATVARSLPGLRHAELIAWATWPVLPLACWGLWIRRRDFDALILPVLGALISLLWCLSGPVRSLGILVMLIPLTLLASAGADRLRRGAASAFGWFGLTTFSFAACLIWLGASAQALDWPPRIARNFEKLAPGHEVHYSLPVLAFAIAVTLVWLLAWRLARTPWRSSLQWAWGATLFWVLIASLWISWIDHAKSYRSTALSLQAALPADAGCIERAGLGPAQRASLDYFAAIRTTSAARGSDGNRCRLRLTVADTDHATPAGWTEVWRGGRPSDRKERWYLERRDAPAR